MSKIGRVNLDLADQANELGFSTVSEALDNGYRIEWLSDGEVELRKSRKSPAQKTFDEEQEEAHEAWLKEKEEVIKGLVDCYKHLHGFPPEVYDKILRAIEFIKKGEA